MPHSRFAGSRGVLDVPAPAWIINDDLLFSQWGTFLLALIKHGTVETIRRDQPLAMEPTEFGLVIEGGLFATDGSDAEGARVLLIQFLKRGDLFSPAIGNTLQMHLKPHCRTTCLVVRHSVIEAFKADFPAWDRLLPLLWAGMARAYSQAVTDSVGRDQDKIHRVLKLMAEHPTAIDSKLGREIEAGKQQIRDLAGVQKRSATRAFRALEDSGVVSFYGYKRLFYKG